MKRSLSILLLSVVAVVSCKKDTVDVQQNWTPYALEYGDFPPPQIPPDNPLRVQGVKLGRMLFYETRLSGDNTMSCASCHRQEDAFTDTARFSVGIEGMEGRRQAMSVFNMAWNTNEFFWDGRAHLLRHQSLMPIQDPLEMNETLANAIAKLQADQVYRDQFIRAFGTDEITEERISLALEQFMNSIVSTESKYDRFLRGDDVLTSSEEHGRFLFFNEFNPFFPDSSGADCAHCHGGPNFENDKYLNNGLDADGDMQDSGRAEVTGMDFDMGKFKVVSLRNIELTAPYMHDGRFNTLEEVIDHYDMGIKMSSTLDLTLYQVHQHGGLGLTDQDKQDLIAFLKTLTDEVLMSDPRYSDPN